MAITTNGKVFIWEPNSLQEAKRLVRQIAKLATDGECASCLKDGEEPNPECAVHEPWILENDDAVDTLQELISTAREIRSRLLEVSPR
jgi:hypothetical protein